MFPLAKAKNVLMEHFSSKTRKLNVIENVVSSNTMAKILSVLTL